MRLLENRVVLITGSTSGIGYGMAQRCKEEGAEVVIHGRTEEKTQRIAEAFGRDVGFVSGDLRHQGVCEAIVDSVVSQYGAIHGLINNAAISPRTNVETSDSDAFDKIMGNNLKAPLMIIRRAVSHFSEQTIKGNIVNIGSINAYCGQTDLLLYSMSKGALMTMTRNLGDSLGPAGIRVNQLNVGWTLTENEKQIKAQEGYEPGWEHRLSKTFAPSGRLLHPEDIARQAAFWVSDASAPVSGSVIDIEQYPVIGRNKIAG